MSKQLYVPTKALDKIEKYTSIHGSCIGRYIRNNKHDADYSCMVSRLFCIYYSDLPMIQTSTLLKKGMLVCKTNYLLRTVMWHISKYKIYTLHLWSIISLRRKSFFLFLPPFESFPMIPKKLQTALHWTRSLEHKNIYLTKAWTNHR